MQAFYLAQPAIVSNLGEGIKSHLDTLFMGNYSPLRHANQIHHFLLIKLQVKQVAWDEKNPFVAKSEQHLETLADICSVATQD